MAEAFTMKWDQDGERLYETGVDRGVVYPHGGKAAAWNGLVNTTVTPEGGEANPFYANNKKYLNILSEEEVSMSIEAYTYPEEFKPCLGVKELAKGVGVGQQARAKFDYSYRSLIGNDVLGNDFAYKIHLVYNCLASPHETANNTVNDSVEIETMSFECTTTKVEAPGMKPTAHIEIESNKVTAEQLAALEVILYGSGDTEARCPKPAELVEIFADAISG